jgi:hypothetical protein
MIVLNEPCRQTKSLELVGTECFGEEAPTVLEYVGDDHHHVFQVSGFDSNLHASAS